MKRAGTTLLGLGLALGMAAAAVTVPQTVQSSEKEGREKEGREKVGGATKFRHGLGSNPATSQEQNKSAEPVIAQALKYIASTQRESGIWRKADKEDLSHLSDLEWQRFGLTISSLNALALWAGGSTTRKGPHQKTLAKARDAIMKWLSDDLGKKYKKGKRFSGSALKRLQFRSRGHGVPWAVLFLAHVYGVEKTDKLKQLLIQCRDFLVQTQQKEGGWTYAKVERWERRRAMGSMTFITNITVPAVLALRHIGIDVEPKILEHAARFYTQDSLLRPDGAFIYGKFRDVTGQYTAIGRTVAALWPMALLGLTQSKTFKNAQTYSTKHLQDCDRSQHGPDYHVFCVGLSCYYAGSQKTLWKKFKEAFWPAILKAQKPDGSIALTPRPGSNCPIGARFTAGGPLLTTPLYALLLQLEGGHLFLDKLQPVAPAQEKAPK